MLRKTAYSHRHQTSQNKNGLNRRERSRKQVMLKGRGKRVHSGIMPGRGKGRTAHGRRG